jgi:DNA-binding winged helix-turn-helix (wHTH) protein
VEEGNLKVQMSALRKVLSEDRDVIKTIHGRGYVFASEVTAAPAERMPLTAPGAHSLDRRPSDTSHDKRGNLAAMAVENGKPGRAVRLQQSEIFLNQALNSARATAGLIHIARRQ